MLCYVSFDGDGIGQKVGRARLADDVEAVRRFSQAIDQGNEIWRSWALSTGGSVVELGGDEGALEIPADRIGELPALRDQYAGKVGATVSVGVGMKLGESSKALLAAKLKGKDQIVFFSDECDDLIEQAQKHPQTEAGKIADEYLNKAAPAMNAGAFAGASHPAAPTTDKPVATQGDSSEMDALNGVLGDENAPAPAERTHAGADFEKQLHDEAWKGEEEDMAKGGQAGQRLDQVKAQIVQALQTLKAQAQVMEQMKQVAPQAYQAMVGLTQSVVAMARELAPTRPQEPMAKREKGRVTATRHPVRADDGDIYQYVSALHTGSRADLNKVPMDTSFRLVDVPLKNLPALRHASNAQVQTYSQLKTPFPPIVIGRGGSIPDGHHRIAAARLRGDKTIRAYVPMEEMGRYAVAKMKKAEPVEGQYPKHMDDVEIFDYFRSIHLGGRGNLLKSIPYDIHYELVEMPVADLVSGVAVTDATAQKYAALSTPFPPIIMKTEGAQPLDGNHRVTAARIRGQQTIRAYVPLVKAEPLTKMALIHDDATNPMTVYRVQNTAGEGPYSSKAGVDAMLGRDKPKNADALTVTSFTHPPRKDFSPEEHHLMGQHNFAFEKPEHATDWFEKPMLDHLATRGFKVTPVKAKKVWRSQSGKQVMFEPQEDMEKGGLPMPGASAHHNVVLPVGSTTGSAPSGAVGTALAATKIKTQHGDGTSGWHQATAGQIMSQDRDGVGGGVAGHAVSSREPNAK